MPQKQNMSSKALVPWPELQGLPPNINPIATPPHLPALPPPTTSNLLPSSTNALTLYDYGTALRNQGQMNAPYPGVGGQGALQIFQAPPSQTYAGLHNQGSMNASPCEPGVGGQGPFQTHHAPPMQCDPRVGIQVSYQPYHAPPSLPLAGHQGSMNAPSYESAVGSQGSYQSIPAPLPQPHAGLRNQVSTNAPSYNPAVGSQGSYQSIPAPPLQSYAAHRNQGYDPGIGSYQANPAPLLLSYAAHRNQGYDPGVGSYQANPAPPLQPYAGLHNQESVNAPPHNPGIGVQELYKANHAPPPQPYDGLRNRGSMNAPLHDPGIGGQELYESNHAPGTVYALTNVHFPGPDTGPDSRNNGIITTRQAPARDGLPITANGSPVSSVFALGSAHNCWICTQLSSLAVFKYYAVDRLFCLYASFVSFAIVVLLVCLPRKRRPLLIPRVCRVMLQVLFITMAGYVGDVGKDFYTMVFVYAIGLLYIPIANIIGLYQNFGLLDTIIAVAGEGSIHLSIHLNQRVIGFIITYTLVGLLLGIPSYFEFQIKKRE